MTQASPDTHRLYVCAAATAAAPYGTIHEVTILRGRGGGRRGRATALSWLPFPHRWLTAFLLVTLPIIFSLLLALGFSQRELHKRADLLSDVTLERAGQITDQIAAAFRSLHVYDPDKACSPSAVNFMRSVDLSSSLLQGVGYIVRNALQCSSLGTVPTYVGEPDYVSSTSTAFRRERTLAEARRTPLLLVSDADGYTALIHPSLLFSPDGGKASVPEGLVSFSTRITIISRGEAAIDWSAAPIDGSNGGSFTQAGYVVAWKRSPTWDHFSYAAVSTSVFGDLFLSMSAIFVPLGLLGSLVCLLISRRLAAARASLPVQLRQGLRRGEVVVVYQPVADLATGQWVGAEVLARWQRSSGEWISPDVFVPIAEQYGVIRDLTRAVVEQCSADFAEHFSALPGFFLSINITSSDLAAPEFPAEMAAVCRGHGLSPTSFHLEVTERGEVKLAAEIEGILTLRGQGFAIGIDDFGVGYSNLAYIDRLTLDYLKIDRVFVADAMHGNLGPGIIEHIIAIAAERRLTVIAEGIEHPEQRAALLNRGVRYGQGWLFGKPMPVEEFVVGLAARAAGSPLPNPAVVSHVLSDVA